LNELLDNKTLVLIWPSHGVKWERHEHSCLTTHSPLLYLHPTLSYAALKLGSSFCRTCICTYEHMLLLWLTDEDRLGSSLTQACLLCVHSTTLECVSSNFLSKPFADSAQSVSSYSAMNTGQTWVTTCRNMRWYSSVTKLCAGWPENRASIQNWGQWFFWRVLMSRIMIMCSRVQCYQCFGGIYSFHFQLKS
jgi:hypothetical protein